MTANRIFSHIEEDQFLNTKGLYDKLIIDCAFREDISLKRKPDGGCPGFYPTLTTNGMCYTFNGKPTSELWQSSKMIDSFTTLFPSHPTSNKTFGGSRSVQGMFISHREGIKKISMINRTLNPIVFSFLQNYTRYKYQSILSINKQRICIAYLN